MGWMAYGHPSHATGILQAWICSSRQGWMAIHQSNLTMTPLGIDRNSVAMTQEPNLEVLPYTPINKVYVMAKKIRDVPRYISYGNQTLLAKKNKKTAIVVRWFSQSPLNVFFHVPWWFSMFLWFSNIFPCSPMIFHIWVCLKKGIFPMIASHLTTG